MPPTPSNAGHTPNPPASPYGESPYPVGTYGTPPVAGAHGQYQPPPGYPPHPGMQYLPYPAPARLSGAGLMLAVANLALCVVIICTGFLTWYDFGSHSYTGFSEVLPGRYADGVGVAVWTALLGVVGIVALSVRRRGMSIGHGVVTMVVSLILALGCLSNISDLSEVSDVYASVGAESFGFEASAGPGLVMALVCSVVLLVVGIAQLFTLPKKAPVFPGQ